MTTIYECHFITAREARDVARALNSAGYKTATRANCREYILNIANHFEPGDLVARQKVLNIICKAAGIQPREEE